jgi:hypothetical protein
MPTVGELIKHLKETYAADDVIAYDLWVTEDVIGRAEEWPGIELSEEQARDILEEVHRHKDCTIGINWDVLDCYIPLPDDDDSED